MSVHPTATEARQVRRTAATSPGRDGDYTDMAVHYDRIMVEGAYYDYAAIAAALSGFVSRSGAGSLLELGAGTGLILAPLAATHPGLELAGVDLTPPMLARAAERLADRPGVQLFAQDVRTMDLSGRRFDAAFSYGGVMYWVLDGDRYELVSHLTDPRANDEALDRIGCHLVPGGTLLLGVQGPHRSYDRPFGDGCVYTQRIEAAAGGFTKHYGLADDGVLLMEQTLRYRVDDNQQALDLLQRHGFTPAGTIGAPDDCGRPLFVTFTR